MLHVTEDLDNQTNDIRKVKYVQDGTAYSGFVFVSICCGVRDSPIIGISQQGQKKSNSVQLQKGGLVIVWLSENRVFRAQN